MDGSTSAGLIISTYYGPGTKAKVTGNQITNNTDGLSIGYSDPDTSAVMLQNNNLTGQWKLRGINIIGGAIWSTRAIALDSNVTGLGSSTGLNGSVPVVTT